MFDELVRQLKGDEGFRSKPYEDSLGILTVGYGRNLEDVGISEPEAAQLLWNDANMAVKEVQVKLPWVKQLSEARQGVLYNMAFNMSFSRLATFTKMLQCLQDGKYEAAAIEMENSKWAKQVGARAQRLILQMRSDKWVFLNVPN